MKLNGHYNNCNCRECEPIIHRVKGGHSVLSQVQTRPQAPAPMTLSENRALAELENLLSVLNKFTIGGCLSSNCGNGYTCIRCELKRSIAAAKLVVGK